MTPIRNILNLIQVWLRAKVYISLEDFSYEEYR